MRIFIRAQVLTTLFLLLIPIVSTISYISVHFWSYPILPYYQNYVRFVTHQENFDAYISYFDPRLPEIYRLASLIQVQTKSTDRIFAWGDLPVIYALTGRLPVGKYTSGYHINDFGAYGDTIAQLRESRPKFILVDRKTQYAFPALYQFLTREYMVDYSSTSFILYKL